MQGIHGYFNPPAQSENGIGLHQLPPLERRTQQLEGQRDLHVPAPDIPDNWAPHLNSQATSENISSAVGSNSDLVPGSFPSWMQSARQRRLNRLQ